jgi:hypothetical protein
VAAQLAILARPEQEAPQGHFRDQLEEPDQLGQPVQRDWDQLARLGRRLVQRGLPVTQDHLVGRPARLGMPAFKGPPARPDLRDIPVLVLRDRLVPRARLEHLVLGLRGQRGMPASKAMPVRLVRPGLRVRQRGQLVQLVLPVIRVTLALLVQRVRLASPDRAADLPATLDLPVLARPVQQASPVTPDLPVRWDRKDQPGIPAPQGRRGMTVLPALRGLRALMVRRDHKALPVQPELMACSARPAILAQRAQMVPLALPDRRAP